MCQVKRETTEDGQVIETIIECDNPKCPQKK